MKNLYLNKVATDLPKNYSEPVAAVGVKPIKTHQGITYTLIGTSEKTYNYRQRAAIGAKYLTKLVRTCESNPEAWKAFSKGKRTVAVYSEPSFLADRILAAQGNLPAIMRVGDAYLKGEKTKKSYEQAYYYYGLAASEGNVEANLHLAGAYLKGEGVKPSFQKAHRYLKTAAELGSVSAMIEVGVMSFQGKGTKKSEQEAFKWFKKAADAKDPEARFFLGIFYFNGHGVEVSDTLALQSFRKATRQNHLLATMAVVKMYADGRGTEKSMEKAHKYFMGLVKEGSGETMEAIMKRMLSELQGFEKLYGPNVPEALPFYIMGGFQAVVEYIQQQDKLA